MNFVNNLKSTGSTIISTWGNGFVSDRYLTKRGIENISEIKLKLVPEKSRVTQISTFGLDTSIWHRLSTAMTGSVSDALGSTNHTPSFTFGPTFAIADDSANVLSEFKDDRGPSVVLKDLDTWQSVYSCSPVMNPDLIRKILVKRGLHTYLNSNDICYINESFIRIQTLNAGIRELTLPTHESLYEVFRDQELTKAMHHRLDLTENKTYLFYRGSKSSWNNL